ncbi:response regulator transcription factor [Tsuneonella sp. CC-YZS046]|uniref:response regulator transcription factor n=1 Tax=Tsuneonella sp. CC-YZS046 TaxID=3042152 RepID=UPI002D7A2E83|nr:response regulator transcription factor [Tsuneonella sp. CC-YZS046]WRO66224.1 response regulator transcription factor [Tsuneonella sp. CC-YZS046]
MTSPSILLVEDDVPLRTLTARALREHGYHVRAVATGAEMWVVLENEPVDLIVLDIMLPGTSGIDLLRRMRRTQDTPVIFISARGSEEDRVVGLELGADDYLGKPFSTRELIARIGAVLRRHGGQGIGEARRETGELRFQGWKFSTARRELHSPSGAIVDLTGAEFDLLNVFLGQPQRVIGRERLIELSRTRLADSSDRSVDVLVSRLRRKLSTAGGKAPIKTVRGIGYMFSAEVSRH